MVDGWFRSGDLGTKDDDGYITIVDRTKDMILRNGYNVYPREVEEVLSRHPAVAQVAVFGIAHATHGQEVMAAVILAAGATADRGGAHRLRDGAPGGIQVPAPDRGGRVLPDRAERQGAQAHPGRPVPGGARRGVAVAASEAAGVTRPLPFAQAGRGRLW